MQRRKKKKNAEVEPWLNSKAKHILRKMIISGTVTGNHEPEDVFKLCDLFQSYPFPNFKTNLANLIDAVAKDYDRLQLDLEAFGHDQTLKDELRAANPPPPPKCPNWHQHEARHLLAKDVEKGRHEDKAPLKLWMERNEYQEFPLDVFRNHIYQEVDKNMKQAARFDKKKLRSMAVRDSVRDTALTIDEMHLVKKGKGVPAKMSNLAYPIPTQRNKQKGDEETKKEAPVITTVKKKKAQPRRTTATNKQGANQQPVQQQDRSKIGQRKQQVLDRLRNKNKN